MQLKKDEKLEKLYYFVLNNFSALNAFIIFFIMYVRFIYFNPLHRELVCRAKNRRLVLNEVKPNVYRES